MLLRADLILQPDAEDGRPDAESGRPDAAEDGREASASSIGVGEDLAEGIVEAKDLAVMPPAEVEGVTGLSLP
jgi:hypothetical protein